MNTKSKPNILIVDDEPENIRILANLLKKEFIPLAATNGIDALKQAVSETVPEIILLDIVMPDMDGYEVCRHLKSKKKTRDIPVIFISALDDVSEKVKGFSLGAVDYITKPFHSEEVLVRVRTHTSMWNMKKKLEKQNKELIELIRLREDIESISRHDMKSPLQAVLGYCDLLTDEQLSEKALNRIKIIKEAGLRIHHMVNISLDLLKMEKKTYVFEPLSLDILKLIRGIINERESIINSKKLSGNILIREKPAAEGDEFHVLGEEHLCYSMLMNLLDNAFEASPPGEQVTISLNRDDMCVISIHNKGIVPEDIKDRFFEKYVTSGKKKGTGLGTYSAKLIAETQEGSLHLETSKENGTTVTIRLPGYPGPYSGPKPDQERETGNRKQGTDTRRPGCPACRQD